MPRPVELLRRRWRLVTALCLLLLAMCAFYVVVFVEFSPISRAGFNLLRTGMTRAEVENNLGEPSSWEEWHKLVHEKRIEDRGWFPVNSWGEQSSFPHELTMSSWLSERWRIDVMFDSNGTVRGARLFRSANPESFWDRLRRWLGR